MKAFIQKGAVQSFDNAVGLPTQGENFGSAEHMNGIQEVGGSIPPGSTNKIKYLQILTLNIWH
jgi:hypothetical protein